MDIRANEMLDTVPKNLTADLKRFCQMISAERPRYVKSRPFPHSVFAECFDNVSRVIGERGGETVYGWAIWHLKGAYFEAEHHGIWQKKSGDWLDVTPQVSGYRKIAFLPDPEAVYDPLNFRVNILQSEVGSKIGADIVDATLKRNEIEARYRADGARAAIFSDEDNREHERLTTRINDLLWEYAGNQQL